VRNGQIIFSCAAAAVYMVPNGKAALLSRQKKGLERKKGNYKISFFNLKLNLDNMNEKN
jgi:hypothetical protein